MLEDHPSIPPDVVPPLRDFDVARNHDELGLCPLCSRAYTSGWYGARHAILLRMRGLTLPQIGRRMAVTPPAIRYHLQSAGVLTSTSFEMHVLMARNRFRLSPTELQEAGAVLSADGTHWVAPLVNTQRRRRSRKGAKKK